MAAASTLKKKAGKGRAARSIPKRDEKGRVVAFEPTVEQRSLVQNMAGINCTVEEIIHCVPWGRADGAPISEDTLRKYFPAELKRGRSLAGMRLKKKAAEMALEGDRTMLIFLLKTQHGYSETVQVQNLGADGKPAAAAPTAVVYLPAKDVDDQPGGK